MRQRIEDMILSTISALVVTRLLVLAAYVCVTPHQSHPVQQHAQAPAPSGASCASVTSK
jgi:hypothetical protein